MPGAAALAAGSLSPFEQLRLAREIVRSEALALVGLADSLGDEFCQAA